MKNQTRRFIPMNVSREDIRRIYSKLSGIYDIWGAATESKAINKALQFAEIKDGESILEVAVGTGRVFEKIVSLNRNGRNEGLDLSPDMLAVARKHLKGKGSNYSLRVADAYLLPFPDITFDLVVNNYMFDLLPEEDFPSILSEFKRVLKSGGRLVITSMTRGRKWYSHTWDRLLHEFPHLLAGCRPISLRADVDRAGFENVREEYVSQFTLPSLVIYGETP
jgi:ubiquinone/menaquinone biosynthesis C-methylase UbiE